MATFYPLAPGRREWGEHVPSPKGTTQRMNTSIPFIGHSPELGVMAPTREVGNSGLLSRQSHISSKGTREHIVMGKYQFLPQFPLLEEEYCTFANNIYTHTYQYTVPSPSS